MRDSLGPHQVTERWFPVTNCAGCTDASGELQIKASMVMRHALCLHRQDTLQITQPTIAVGLGWERLPGYARGGARTAVTVADRRRWTRTAPLICTVIGYSHVHVREPPNGAAAVPSTSMRRAWPSTAGGRC